MTVDRETRERVDMHQRSALAALVAGSPDPPGFDDHRLDRTREALLHKRAREAAAAWPDLSLSVGADYIPRFVVWAATMPFPADGGARADGLGFATCDVHRSELDTHARIELLGVRAMYRGDRDGMVKARRAPWIGATLTADGLAIAWARGRGAARRAFLRTPRSV